MSEHADTREVWGTWLLEELAEHGHVLRDVTELYEEVVLGQEPEHREAGLAPGRHRTTASGKPQLLASAPRYECSAGGNPDSYRRGSLSSLFLLVVGAGAWSFDASRRRRHATALSREATMNRCAALVLAFIACSCAGQPSDSTSTSQTTDTASVPASEAWLLSGTNEERFARVARQLRGFDVAMVETGYRYGELYWAGQDGNWDYAKYQLDKIRLAVRNGLERRPKRGPSAQILENVLPEIEQAIAAKDPSLFAQRFEALTATCNACHQAEQVAFFHVQRPTVRSAPIGPLPGAGRVP